MIKILFREVIPDQNLLSKIDDYLYNRKSQLFVYRGLQMVSQNLFKQYSMKQIQMRWQFLIRDSEGVIIQFDDHELNGFNFAYFLQNILRMTLPDEIWMLVEKLCIQLLKININLIFNRYYVGNGGSPAYQMIYTYTMAQQVNSSSTWPLSEQKQKAAFNILSYILQTNQIRTYHHMRPFTYSHPHIFFTDITLKSILTVYKYIKHYLLGHRNDNSMQDYDNTYQINYYFDTTFSQLMRLYQSKQYQISSWVYYRWSFYLTDLEYFDKFHPKLKQNIQKFLIILSVEFIQLYDKFQIGIIMIQKLRVKSIKNLIEQSDQFRKVLFNQSTIIFCFKKIKKQICEYILSIPEYRNKISEYQDHGQNILQIVASLRSLTHNMISLLWETGKFVHMPRIVNLKSRKIIQAKYELGLQL